MQQHFVYYAILTSLPAIAQNEDSSPGFNEATFSGLEMRSIGPAMMSGRIADIAINPEDPSTWYVGVGEWWHLEDGKRWHDVDDYFR